MPGRPAKPKALHIVHGTARKSRMAKRAGELELKPGSIGKCPTWICPEGREEWTRLVKDAEYASVLAPVMRGAVIDYCNLYGRMVRAERRLPMWVDGKEAPAETKRKGKVIPPPRETISASERQTLHSLRMQLGLTPASQSKVKLTKPTESENKFARFKR